MNKLIIFFLLANISHALVDYSDNTNESSASAKSSTKISPMTKIETKSSLVWKSDISVESNYEMLQIDNKNAGKANFDIHLQTPMNIYFDLSYWHASAEKQTGAGNPKFILGINWLRIGNSADEAQFNLMAGARLKSNSDLGTSRNDKIFGVETTKKFGNFGLGIGYEMNLTSEPAKSSELAIGNIQRLDVSAGWMATNDIQFELTAENYKVSKSTSQLSNRLLNDLSFSTLTSKLNLLLFPSVNFELGARFRMQKAKADQDLKYAGLMDLNGIHSNSVFSGLNISI